jgi:uncharacterized protein YegP (UPF0339 family)
MRIVIFRSSVFGRQWYFRIVAANNRIVAQSEGYKRKASAVKTAKRIRDDLYLPIKVA